ncbi:TolB-like protein [Xanthomonas vesicatoria ATCC 35937]|nr:PD40 domain-containing protein [Xanthomonas vesicatoria]APP77777.1 TolB-like protein [Xanthomonas vesicatoria ATCC 35937]KTF32872.1 TolB-like protein [Xanthomonas vesicatoria]MCC8598600.1 PD40 domain-containing protein [Xanthomonas vesicatoria]MCC8604706.1 PD40 domain-containing protein [Xanthomonas vesicatoria]MCC8626220.1 PD40 domain-containing protein [Xanthomonas vesicatoria]
MQLRWTPLALAASLLFVPSASGLAEFGIEGMGVVSTPANEAHATLSPDGQRIVWASDRAGGAGGWDLWQAHLQGGRWQDAQPLSLNTAQDEITPLFSADGRWLLFASSRSGGAGGSDLYRVPVDAQGGLGAVQSLGIAINSRGNERAPSLSLDGTRLLFASDGHGGAGGLDVFVAHWDGRAFAAPAPLRDINTADDELDAAWLGDGRGLLWARGAIDGPSQLLLTACSNGHYAQGQPVPLSFNGPQERTFGAVVDAAKPGELLVTGRARAPRAGQLDIYRMKAPAAEGDASCR